MREPVTLEYAKVGEPRRLFAWEHAMGAGAVTALVVVMAFVLAPVAERELMRFGAVLPWYATALLEGCRVIRRFGWMLAWFPAVTVGFVAAAMGARGKRMRLVLRVWVLIGVVVGVVMGVGLYGAVLQLTLKQAGG